MARRRIDDSDPDKLQHYLPVLFSTRDVERIERVAKRYGLKRAAAVRLMMREGADRYDHQENRQEGE